jgi:hypothetical protein
MSDAPELSLYERIILEEFAARYRSSAQRSGGRSVRIADWSAVFPGIKQSADEKLLFLDAMEKLSAKKVISLKWEKFGTGNDLSAAYLEDAEKIFELLGVLHPDEEALRITQSVSLDRARSETARAIIRFVYGLMIEKKEIPFTSEDEYRGCITLAEVSDEEREFLPIRALSVKLFSDSKRIEQLLPKFISVVSRIGKGDALKGLERSYPECMIKGNFLVEFRDGRTWEIRGDIVSFSAETAKSIASIHALENNPAAVCSIENKETFYHIGGLDQFGGYIFCHGHLNEAVKEIIAITFASGNAISHFGDMDPDGIMIFSEINEIVKGACTPFMMNESVYAKYLLFGYDLSGTQLSRLPEKIPGFEKLIDLIREHKKGVEQEIVNYGRFE